MDQDQERPYVVVAHPLTSTGEAIAALLIELRTDYRIERIPVAELDAHLAAGPAAVVICSEPTPTVQARARGWIALLPGGQDVALIGTGDAWRVLPSPSFPAILDAVDELVTRPVPPPVVGNATR